jgi:hypothetical protein
VALLTSLILSYSGGRSVEDLAVEVNKTKEAYVKVNQDYKQAAKLNLALKASLQVRLWR